MKLEKFDKNKKQKRIVIASIVGILLIVGGITLYRTFALYEEKLEFNVLKGRIPDFSSGDIELAYTINGEATGESFPNKGSGYRVNSVICENGVEASWINETWSLAIEDSKNNNKIKCSIDFETIPYFNDYLVTLSNSDTSIIKETHEETEQTGNNATIDYRYVGANPNNYVCLEESGSCTEDQLYRIIGVIPIQSSEDGPYENRVKLIKVTEYDKTAWDSKSTGSSSYWINSTSRDTLNKYYWDSISSYQKYIDSTKWYIGGFQGNDLSIRTTSNIYKGERGSEVLVDDWKISSVDKIGLMYPSDYGYATNGGTVTNRNTCLSHTLAYWDDNDMNDCLVNNWLYNSSITQWTITPVVDVAKTAYIVFKAGYVGKSNVEAVGNWPSVFPVFHLKSKVIYKSGDGSKENPYQIEIE